MDDIVMHHDVNFLIDYFTVNTGDKWEENVTTTREI